jgi:hypothetical protein
LPKTIKTSQKRDQRPGERSTRAAAPAAGKQTPGWYRYKVGEHEITVVTDGVNRFPLPGSFVANVKNDEVNAALAAAFMDKDKLAIPYSPIVVNTGATLVVIDTGTGEANFTQSKGAGQFRTSLTRHSDQYESDHSMAHVAMHRGPDITRRTCRRRRYGHSISAQGRIVPAAAQTDR